MLKLLIRYSREPERPVASVGGVRDVTERPRNEVIVVVVEYYCFLIITIVGPPYLADPVWPLKYTHFSKTHTNVASKR